MSQKKVEEYKASKKTRKEEIAKQKRNAKLRKLGLWAALAVVVIGLITGLVITIVNQQKAKAESAADLYNETNLILQDYADIEGTATEAETEETAEETEAAEEETEAE